MRSEVCAILALFQLEPVLWAPLRHPSCSNRLKRSSPSSNFTRLTFGFGSSRMRWLHFSLLQQELKLALVDLIDLRELPEGVGYFARAAGQLASLLIIFNNLARFIL